MCSIYNKKSAQQSSNSLTLWKSSLATYSIQLSYETNSNAPNTENISKTKNKKIYYTLFDKNDFVCLKWRHRTPRLENWKYHIQSKHGDEENGWLREQKCNECEIKFSKVFQYQQHYIGFHDTRTDEEVREILGLNN